jgi:hypothetical protein
LLRPWAERRLPVTHTYAGKNLRRRQHAAIEKAGKELRGMMSRLKKIFEGEWYVR